MNDTSVVYLVDDDPVIGRAASRLLAAFGLSVRSYVSPREFIAEYDPELPGCVILDVVMPDLDGLEVQKLIRQRGGYHPIIFLTGEGRVTDAVAALKAGAVDFLGKPFDGDVLLAAVQQALEKDARLRAARGREKVVQSRLDVLTDREREVFGYVSAGWLNKEIAAEIGIAERTVKFHRSNLMDKIGASSVADLVRLATQLGVESKPPPNLH